MNTTLLPSCFCATQMNNLFHVFLSFRVVTYSCCCRWSPRRGLQLEAQVHMCVGAGVCEKEFVSPRECTLMLCVCVCDCIQHRCGFSLRPPALPVALPPSEASGLQRVAAALLTAHLNSGPCTWCHADHAGWVTFVFIRQIAEVDRGIQNTKGEIDLSLTLIHKLIPGIEHGADDYWVSHSSHIQMMLMFSLSGLSHSAGWGVCVQSTLSEQ